jgi:hypothetical protein
MAEATMGSLTREQVEQFKRDGYLAIPGHASKEQCQKLISRIGELLRDFDPEATRRSVFSTTNQVGCSLKGMLCFC